MEQSHVIEQVTRSFAKKLELLKGGYKNLEVVIDGESQVKDAKKAVLTIVLLGLEPKRSQNMFEKIQKKGKDEKGAMIEYFVTRPTLFTLRFMLVPRGSSRMESVKLLGMTVKLLKDDMFIESGECDWADNDGQQIVIEETLGVDLDKQLQLFGQLGMEYTPSLFYHLTIGIDSGKKEVIRRVEERKFDMFDKDMEKKPGTVESKTVGAHATDTVQVKKSKTVGEHTSDKVPKKKSVTVVGEK
jgi:hypothetical protein